MNEWLYSNKHSFTHKPPSTTYNPSISTCALGSHMLVESMEDLIDPILEKFELPTLKANPSTAAAIQTSAVMIGVASQLRGNLPFKPLTSHKVSS